MPAYPACTDSQLRRRGRVSLLLACLLSATAGWSQSSFGQSDSQTVKIGETQFTIPSDMQLELVADEPLTTWPILADWDAQGRLIVVESGGVSKPIVEHNKQLLHRVVRLEDEDGDGRFDKRTVVAKDLPFMEGVLCVGQDFLVTAPPNIYRLIDADGDGVCEGRQVWFDGQTITGCANDLHGPYMGRDGWIYWCKGAFAEQQHQLLDGSLLKSTAAHIFRRRLSGGAIEPVMTGGMDNPVSVAITPEGERFFTSTFLHHPGAGLRDGVAHAVYGSVFGKDQPVLAGHIRTGALMPVMVDLGAAAPSGLICLNSSQLIPSTTDHQRTLVATLFNLQKVTALRLQPQGATFATHNQDLVVGDRIDFHPTGVLEDSDGSLLIIDTGGWYDLCCPSSRVDQKTAAGGIYRLSPATSSSSRRQRSARQEQTPDSSAADVVQRLLDPRPWVVRQAQLRLLQLEAGPAKQVVEELQRRVENANETLDHRLIYLWGLSSVGSQEALAEVAALLPSPQASLAQAACHVMALYRYKPAQAELEQLLKNSSAQVRRAAGEALGRIGDAAATDKLLASLAEFPAADRHWQHSVTFAIIELAQADVLIDFLAQPQTVAKATSLQKHVALLALEQMGAAEQLSVAMLLDGLNSDDEIYRRTASEILARHPQWAEKYRAAIDNLYTQARGSALQLAADSPLATIVRGWRETATVQDLIRQWIISAPSRTASEQQQLGELLNNYADSQLPSAWSLPLTQWLSQTNTPQQLALAHVISHLKLSQAEELTAQLVALAKSATSMREAMTFLAAVPIGTRLHDSALEQALVAELIHRNRADKLAQAGDTEDSPAGAPAESTNESRASATAVDVLQRVVLAPESARNLLLDLQAQPSRSLLIVVEAISRAGDDELDKELLTKLRELPAARTLAEDQILNLYRMRSPELQTEAAKTVASLTRAPSDIEEKVEAVLAQLKAGDPIRGLQLFRSNKTACSGCHRMGYVGGEIGPNLTRIGSSRTRRALLEAILFPSSRLEQSYQPTKILTHDGQVFNGLVTKHLGPTQFVLQLTADKSLVLSTEDVARQEASPVSIMPSGIAELLSSEELADLLAILESAK